MKHIIIAIAIFMVFTANAQVDYYNTTTNGTNASAIGLNNEADGDNAFVGGGNSKAQGQNSFAFGLSAETHATNAVALGLSTKSNGVASFTIGKCITANGTDSYVIGKGITSSYRLVNDIPNSLMIGMNSTKPTFFVSQSYGLEGTGKIGIGNVTNPLAKLHIKADDNEDASLLLEADNNDYVASLSFNNTNTRIEAQSGESMHFYSENNYIFAEGDIFLEDINSGIVMKSPDGQCWRGQVDNSGSLQFSPVDCSTITAMAPISEPLRSTIKIFPNPTSNILHFHSDTSLKDIAIEIFNLKGQAILTHTWSGRETDINLGNFLSGNYVIKIFDADHKLVEQQKIIIVQR